MNDRELLPARRRSENMKIESNGVYMTATVGRYPDGRPGEVFVSDIKFGTVAESICHDAAVILSIALQYGAQVDVLAAAMTRDGNGNPHSFLGALADHLAKEKKERDGA